MLSEWPLTQTQPTEEGKTPPEGNDDKSGEKRKDEAKSEEKAKESKDEVGVEVFTRLQW